MLLSSRWLALIAFFLITLSIYLVDRKSTHKEKLKKYGTMFIEGMVGGFIIDAVFINCGYYEFPRQPFLSWKYFAIVIPCWGVFGLLINVLWNWIGKEKFWRGISVTLIPLFAYYEGTNLAFGSWTYTVSMAQVAVGWLPLIIVFAGCNRRRKVVYKLDMWSLGCDRTRLFGNVYYYGLQSLKVLTTIIMFPLLITNTVKMLAHLKEFRDMDYTAKEYFEYLMVE